MNEFNPQIYKDAELVKAAAKRIESLVEKHGKPLRIMHICGTHEHEMARYGLRYLLPKSVEVLAGPGCPVCVCDAEYIDQIIQLALTENLIVTSFGDMMAVPGSIPLKTERKGDVRMSLLDAKAAGGDVRAVYSVFDAAKIAEDNPEKEVVFFSVGFETTIVAVAALLKRGVAANFSIIEANYYTPPATHLLPTLDGFDIQGFLLPGHAAAISGLGIYEHLPELGIACASAGFEPLDQLLGIAAILQQIVDGEPKIVNSYPRVLKYEGNEKAMAELLEVFYLAEKRWRGIANIKKSGFWLKDKYKKYSAQQRFKDILANPPQKSRQENPKGCRCAEVTLGQIKPTDCSVFGNLCTPDNPYGPCMVSHEGTCRAWFLYGIGQEDLNVEV